MNRAFWSRLPPDWRLEVALFPGEESPKGTLSAPDRLKIIHEQDHACDLLRQEVDRLSKELEQQSMLQQENKAEDGNTSGDGRHPVV